MLLSCCFSPKENLHFKSVTVTKNVTATKTVTVTEIVTETKSVTVTKGATVTKVVKVIKGVTVTKGIKVINCFTVIKSVTVPKSVTNKALALHFDEDFPPNNLSYYGNDDDQNENITWMRASEIAQQNGKDPVFFDRQGASRFDVKQGKIGNCWFLAALSDLPMYPKLFKKVVDPDQNFGINYQGKFRFRFWDFGLWKTIEVDDFLPTLQGQVRGVTSQNSGEFWSALAEKAYAKHYGNYAIALHGGFVAEALEDLTGGIGEEIFMAEISDHSKFFLKLLQAYKMKSMMSASILTSSSIRDENGLVSRHAYSLNKVIEFKLGNETVQLLRSRNPWGSGEWKGQWSDSSKKWENLPSKIKDKLDFQSKVDGEFYISLSDFMKMFDQVTICHLSMDSIDKSADKWKMAELEGSWTMRSGGSGPYANLLPVLNDPQYLIELKDTDKDGFCTILVSVLQKSNDRNSYGSIGFEVFRVDDPAEELPLTANFFANCQIEESHQTQIRRAATKRLHLKPGKFVIIPHNYQKASGSEESTKRFLIRVLHEGRGSFKRLK